MQLLLATTNAGKITEMSEALSGLGLEIKTPKDFSIIDAPEEHGSTYIDNALEKAHFYYERAKIPTLADDSGIIVEALKSELGIHTRRWGAGPSASDEEWISYFLKRMEKVSDRRAKFICVLAYIDSQGTEHIFEGHCDGMIIQTLEASYLPGLPISACFKPIGHSVVYSAMKLEQKNSTSHRGRAILAFREFLKRKSKI